MPKALDKKTREGEEYDENEGYYEEEDLEYEEYVPEEEEYDESLKPSNFPGTGGTQDINYMVYLYRHSLEKRLHDQELSEKRQRGKPPSREHPMHYGIPMRRSAYLAPPEDDLVRDPSYLPEDEFTAPFSPRGRGRGERGSRGSGTSRPRGRPRGSGIGGRGATRGTSRGARGARGGRGARGARGARGSGRGRGGNTSRNTSVSSSSDGQLKHWNKAELKALIFGANHLKPVLKGKFKSSSDGTVMKKLAWEELSEYVESMGKREWSSKQCKDKLLYFGQDAKKKRQYIDSTYRSGSGQRKAEDYLTDLEQGILDWCGEDVVLGIPGMQPPNLKGGGRSEEPWSCYDPHRPDRENYASMEMPSDAMKAVVDGNLLAVDEDGDPMMDEAEYNELPDQADMEEEHDPTNAVDHYMQDQEEEEEEGGGNEPETVPAKANESLPDDNDLRSPPHKSVTKVTMLRFNKRENDKKQGIAQKKKDNKEEDGLSPHAKERAERKKILLEAAAKVVERNTPKKGPEKKPVPAVKQKATTSLTRKKVEVAKSVVKEKVPVLKVADTLPDIKSGPSKHNTEDVLDTEPAPKRKRNRPPSFSGIIDDVNISGVEENDESAVFITSTPASVLNKKVEETAASNKRTVDTNSSHRSDPDRSDSKRRKLFHGLDDGWKAEMEAATRSLLEQNTDIILEQNKKICESLLKHQDELAQNTQETASIMVKALKGVTTGLTNALREHLNETQQCLTSQRDTMLEIQRKALEQQKEEAEEDSVALANVHTELTNQIVGKQVQIVKALDKLSDIMTENCEKLTDAQSKMNVGFIGMQDCVLSLSKSFNAMTISADHLQKRCDTGLQTAATADNILHQIVKTVEKLNEAVTHSVDQNITNRMHTAPSVQVIANEQRQAETPGPNTPSDIPEADTPEPTVHAPDQRNTDDNKATNDNLKTEDNYQPAVLTLHTSNVAAFLTHPETDGGLGSTYHTTEEPFNDAGGGNPLLIPGSAICREASESNDGTGLPSYLVRHKDEFTIVQNTGEVPDGPIPGPGDNQQLQAKTEGLVNQGVADNCALGEVGDESEAAQETEAPQETEEAQQTEPELEKGYDEDEAKSTGDDHGAVSEAGSVSDRDEIPKRSERLRKKVIFQGYLM